MNSYTILSRYYDKLNADCDYYKWSQYLYGIIKGRFGETKSICGADGACGSGKITIQLKKAGLNIYGYDISEGMLNAAYDNAAKEGLNINFIKADLNSYKPPRKLDFINVSNDGINYIRQDRLLHCFKCAHGGLKKGGLFMFDISSPYKLREIIGGNTFSDDTDEVTYIWNNTLEKDGGSVRMDMIFFVYDNGKYLRFDENHIQYIHTESALTELLREAGFSKITGYGFPTYSPAGRDSLRIQFTAEK